MTDTEVDARLAALSDADVQALADDDATGQELTWYRQRDVIRRLAREVLALRTLDTQAYRGTEADADRLRDERDRLRCELANSALVDAEVKAIYHENDNLRAQLRGAVTARNIAERERDNLRRQIARPAEPTATEPPLAPPPPDLHRWESEGGAVPQEEVTA